MLITIEGGEGSGKGTLMKKLAHHLENEGFDVATGREPGSVDVSEEIRQVIQTPGRDLVPEAELLLYEAARAQFVNEFLKPALEENDVVILDRFYDSTTAYQGYGRGLDLDLIRDLNSLASLGLTPDVTIILDVSPEVGLERCRKDEFGKDGDRMEQEDVGFHEKVRDGYLDMAEEEDRFLVVDAESNSVEQVFSIVKEKIKLMLN